MLFPIKIKLGKSNKKYERNIMTLYDLEYDTSETTKHFFLFILCTSINRISHSKVCFFVHRFNSIQMQYIVVLGITIVQFIFYIQKIRQKMISFYSLFMFMLYTFHSLVLLLCIYMSLFTKTNRNFAFCFIVCH